MVQSTNKLCPKCKREFTDKEMAKDSKTCWFCLAEFLNQIEESEKIPAPEEYGRPGGFEELAGIEAANKIKKLKGASSLQQEEATQPEIKLTDKERKEFMEKYGIDPVTHPTTVITVKGKNDDTYLQISIRGTMSPDVKKQTEKWASTLLDLVGTVVTFGPNFAGTIINMKMLQGPEMFLKQ